MLALLVSGLCEGDAPIEAQARGSALVLSSEEGRVLSARLASGALVELDGEMEVQFAGPSARVTFRRACEGILATARAQDVDVRIVRDVWTEGDAIGLGPSARVNLRSVGAREVIVEARGLGVTLPRIALPRDAIALPSRSRPPSESVATPAAWVRAGTGARRLLAATTTLRDAPRGRALTLTRASSVEVAVVEEAEGWTRVALEDSGIRVLVWVEATELTEPAPRSPASGGGGLGEGRIGLSRCQDADARRLYTRSSTRVFRDPDARGVLTVVRPGVTVVVRDRPGLRLAVVELPGAERVGRCERPIGWVSRATLDTERVEPLDEM